MKYQGTAKLMPTIRFYQHSETGWPYECAHKLKYDKDACVCACLCLWENAHGCVDVWMYYVYINICHPSSIIFVMEVRGRRTQCWMKRWETKDVLSPWTHLFLFFSFPPFKWSEWFFISVFPQVMPCFKEKKRMRWEICILVWYTKITRVVSSCCPLCNQ